MRKRSEDETTARLEKILKTVKSESDVDKYIEQHTCGNYDSLSQYFNEYIAKHKLILSEVIEKSGISKNYVYNIINGNRNPGRDKIIALCIGAGMNYDETNRALKIAKAGILYPKDERDARIAIAINNNVGSVIEVNLILEKEDLAVLE